MDFFKFLTSKTFFKHLALIFLASIALVFIILKWLSFSTDHGESILVPDLSGMNLEQARERLSRDGLRFELLDSANFNPDFPPRSVVEQRPEAGQKVKDNRRIYIRINRNGFPNVSIPNIVQITKRNAVSTLRAVGLEIGKVDYINAIGKDMVYGLRFKGKKIEPGAMVPQTSKIDLVLGNGTGTE